MKEIKSFPVFERISKLRIAASSEMRRTRMVATATVVKKLSGAISTFSNRTMP